MTDDIGAWFASRLPKTWFAAPAEVTSDGEEILVLGVLPDVELATGTSPEAREAARVARIDRFREETRDERVKIARDDETRIFTTLSLPVMTRLRMPERAVLDTLVAAGVARSRSDALAWCVRLVGMHQSEWIKGLREALVKVDEVRGKGPLN